MVKHRVKYLIIGGGPCGLGTALHLNDAGEQDWVLLEAQDACGGLSRSFTDDDGFTWDYGGHVLFSHYQTFDHYMEKALGAEGWLAHERESWVWLKNRFIPYPFQFNLHRLDPVDRWACVEGLLRAHTQMQGSDVPADFSQWMQQVMGEGICSVFMKPYNEKVWAWPAEEMDYSWIGERVAVPPLDGVMRSICLNEDHYSWGPNNQFRFPLHGGTGAIWTALAAQLPSAQMQMRRAVVAIDTDAHVVTDAQGDEWHYDKIMSSMPLDQLLIMMRGKEAEPVTSKMRYSSTHVVGIGLRGAMPESLSNKCWMYFPMENSPYYRVTVFNRYSPNNVAKPGQQWSLMAEIAESAFRPVDAHAMAEDTVRALKEDQLLSGDAEIVSCVHRRLKYGYPTPFLKRDALLDPILADLEERHIYSRGRFGAWKYEVGNMDHCFCQGVECARRWLSGAGREVEPTVFQPGLVNSRRNP